MSNSKLASSFAPYTLPPDDPSHKSSSITAATRAWFPAGHIESYQSGGIPTFEISEAGGAGAAEEAEATSEVIAWETRYGMRVDMMAAVAYVLGPISALLLLIIETHNDYVRFHAYQSALLTTPLLLLYIIASLAHFAVFIRTFFTLLLVVPSLYMVWQAYVGAAMYGLTRFQLPIIGPLAEQWVAEE